MYVTRRLSQYRKFPNSLSEAPPAGPNSGYLVIQDEEAETTTCFGLCKDRKIRELPLPQNKNLTIRYSTGSGKKRTVHFDEAILIPVLNKPLSSNQYYAIKPHGSHKGEAYVNSKKEDMGTCCFCSYIRDLKPRPLHPHDIYQQFRIFPYEAACQNGGFYAKSAAPDGFPPYFLRRKGLEIYTKTPENYELGEAPGLDNSLRSQLPNFNSPESSAVVVGKWYCPFMFIKEETLKQQVKTSMYYEMTLEQKWEQIFSSEKKNHGKDINVLEVDVVVQKEAVVFGGGREAVWNERNVGADRMVWFKSLMNEGSSEVSVGLSVAIVERMKWEEERVGWVGGDERRQVSVKRAEVFDKMREWRKFGCYVLVERFALKRMDGSLVLTYDFRHTHQIRTKWE